VVLDRFLTAIDISHFSHLILAQWFVTWVARTDHWCHQRKRHYACPRASAEKFRWS